MKRSLLSFLLTLISGIAICQPINNPADTTINLASVSISAPYEVQKINPFSFQNLTPAYIEKENYGQEPAFILSKTPSMTVYSDAGSYHGYSYFRLRGIDQTRINMSLDGMPLNEPEDQGAYFSNYPDFFNSVNSIQIQRGVGTTKNGSASYAGSIQFTSPNLFQKKKLEVGMGYGSYNSYRAYAEYNSGLSNSKGIYVRASHLHSDGYKHRSANNSQSVFYSAGIFKENNSWKVNGFVGQQKNELAWLGVSEAQIKEDPRSNPSTQENDRFLQTLLQLQHTNYATEYSKIQSSLYYNYLEGNYDFDLNVFSGLPPTDELYNYALYSHLIGGFSNYTYQKNNVDLIAGVHANHYLRNHKGSERNMGLLYENRGLKAEISTFSKISLQLNRFNLFADVQWRYTNFNYEGTVALDELHWNFFNPKAGLVFNIRPELSAYYSIGKTSREPTRNDLFGGMDNLETDENDSPLINIVDPETVVDQELGIRLDKSGLQINANFYYMRFSNEMVLNGQFGPNGLALNTNVDKSYRTGLEIDATQQISQRLELRHAISFNKSRIETSDVSFTPILTPPIIIHEEINYHWRRLALGIDGRYQHEAYIDFSNEAGLDSYFLLNANLNYTFGRIVASLYVNNLTNTKYYNNGYVDFDGSTKLFVQAPANYYLSLKWNIL